MVVLPAGAKTKPRRKPSGAAPDLWGITQGWSRRMARPVVDATTQDWVEMLQMEALVSQGKSETVRAFDPFFRVKRHVEPFNPVWDWRNGVGIAGAISRILSDALELSRRRKWLITELQFLEQARALSFARHGILISQELNRLARPMRLRFRFPSDGSELIVDRLGCR